MPRYDYRCERGHVTESVQGIGTDAIPCTCGRTAGRLAVYRDQFISGETVAKGRTPTRHEALDDKGRFNLRRVVEAQHTLVHQAAKQETQTPDYMAAGKRKAKELRAAGVSSAVRQSE